MVGRLETQNSVQKKKKMLLGVRKDAFRNSRNNGINSKTDF